MGDVTKRFIPHVPSVLTEGLAALPVTDRDLAAWAAEIRSHFEPELQDVAGGAARVLVRAVGHRIRRLRPETRMAEVVSWLKDAESRRSTSLDWVEILMAVEEELSTETTDVFAETLEQRTFREYVEHLHAHRRAAEPQH